MRVSEPQRSVQNLANRGPSAVPQAEVHRSLAGRIAQLNASVRREPRAAAGVIAYWLGKETN